jgi:glycosyltransferase involved in cell wall biosynthesis
MKKLLSDCASSAFNKQVRVIPAMIGIKKIIYFTLLKVMKTLGTRVEKKLVQQVDAFITTCDSFKDYFEKTYNVADLKVVMNCPSLEFTKSIKPKSIRGILNIADSEVICLFQGIMNKGRALHVLIDAFRYTNEEIKLVFIGEGSLKRELIETVALNQLSTKIFFLDKVDSSELIGFTKGADIGVNLQEKINISKELASANKLFEYIHSNLPIIATSVPENIKVIRKYNLGLLVDNDSKQLAEAINTIAVMNKEFFSKNCKIAAEEYNWENQVKKLDEIIASL